jgi:uncharacterized protein
MTAPPRASGHALHQPLLGMGDVRHARLKPFHHAFAYKGYFWLLPMRALSQQEVPVIRRNRWGALSFHDADHGNGQANALAWLDDLLAQAGIDMATAKEGEVWLQTFPRVLGLVFNPVSFWWVHGPDRALLAVVAEVNNTFGERHAYVLSALRMGEEVTAEKVFHVSPFCEVRGRYRFRFMRTGAWGHATALNQTSMDTAQAADRDEGRIVVCIDHDDDAGPVLQTSQSGRLMPLTRLTAWRVFFTHPLMTWGVVARIHWHALRLWWRGLPLVRKSPQTMPPWSK